MTSTKYIGMDVHTEGISIAVRNSVGKVVMESMIETKASATLQFVDGLRGDLRVTFEEGTWAAWLYDLLKPKPARKKWWQSGVLHQTKPERSSIQASKILSYADGHDTPTRTEIPRFLSTSSIRAKHHR